MHATLPAIFRCDDAIAKALQTSEVDSSIVGSHGMYLHALALHITQCQDKVKHASHDMIMFSTAW